MRLSSFEQAEEWYVFPRLCEKDFLGTVSILRMIRRYKRADVTQALLRDGIISQARPFSKNRGPVLGDLQLSVSMVPDTSGPLHRELMDYRKQVFAHTDIEAYKPRLHRWSAETGYWYPMAFRTVGSHRLLDRVSAIFSLVQDVREAVQRKEREIEADWLKTAMVTPDPDR